MFTRKFHENPNFEGEPKTSDYLKQGLTEAGFVADLVRTGADGLHSALTEDYDVVILDVILPGIDDWAVLAGTELSCRKAAS